MMLDAYAACEGDSSAVVAIQNKYLEEARLEKQSRYRGKHVKKKFGGEVVSLSLLPHCIVLAIQIYYYYYYFYCHLILLFGRTYYLNADSVYMQFIQ
jgi:hypothetical protein